MGKTIKLSTTEIMQGALVGVMRMVQNLKNGNRDKHGAERGPGWQYNIEGALGEMALAKFLGTYWAGTGVYRAPDVGDQDVRTASMDGGCLILHPADPDDRVFWLLTGQRGIYTVCGCIRGADGKKQEYWRDPAGGRPAFFVPQSALEFPARMG